MMTLLSVMADSCHTSCLLLRWNKTAWLLLVTLFVNSSQWRSTSDYRYLSTRSFPGVLLPGVQMSSGGPGGDLDSGPGPHPVAPQMLSPI